MSTTRNVHAQIVPATLSLAEFDVLEIRDVAFDRRSAIVYGVGASGQPTTSWADAVAIHLDLKSGEDVEGDAEPNGAVVYLIGETRQALRLYRRDDAYVSEGSSSISRSEASSGEPGSSINSSGERAGMYEPPHERQGAAEVDLSSAGSSTAIEDHEYYNAPQADVDAALRLRDSAPSCRAFVFQEGRQLISSWDARSYEPTFDLECAVNSRHPVTVSVSLGSSWYTELPQAYAGVNMGDKIFSCIVPDLNEFDDGMPVDVALPQVFPPIDQQKICAQVRLVVTFTDFETATLHVVGAHSLPREGIAHEVQQVFRSVFSLTMQLEAETAATMRQLAKSATFS